MTIVLIVLGVLVLWFVFTYNRFVRGRNRVEEAWADIETQLKRRYDLIPNLVNTVKGYAAHESKVLDAVTNARSQAMQAGDVAGQVKAEGALAGALKSLFAVAEAYPDLKANENFLELQRELADTENKIQASRRFYNGTVRDFNTLLETFPSAIVAGMFLFKKKTFFELPEDSAAREPVEVKF